MKQTKINHDTENLNNFLSLKNPKNDKDFYDKSFKAGLKLNYTGGIKMKSYLVILASVLLIAGIVGVVYAATEAPVTASVTVQGVLSISVDSATLSFGTLSPGSTADPTQDPLAITVIANQDYTISTKADAATFTGGPEPFAVSNLEWSLADDGSTWTDYTILDDTIEGFEGSSPGATENLYHQLTVPAGTDAGSYNVGITLNVNAA